MPVSQALPTWQFMKKVFSFLSSQHIKMHLKINEPHTFWIPYMKSIFDGFFYTSYLIV
jgi:hypothetical protein